MDTGMTRLGLTAEDAVLVAQDRESLDSFELTLVMSHLACADDRGSPRNDAQRKRFEDLSALFPGVRRSLANSAGIHLGSEFHFEMTRPGISLYGGRALCTGAEPVEPAAWLFARIAQVRWADAGETVGYGGMTTLTRKTRIMTACAGYADGYMRAASASNSRAGPCGFAGPYPLPLLGRISMDLMTFDATDVPEGSVMRGGWVELLGERVTVDDLAAFAGTIGYEVLTSLGRRYHRVYVDE
jgi:alanine racemase